MNKNILVVDDEVMITDMIKKVYDKYWTIFVVNTHIDCFAIMKEQDIAVLVSDYQMPEGNGLDLIEQIHKIYPQTRKILFSGSIDQKIIDKSQAMGCIDQIFQKPWSKGEFLSIVEEQIMIYDNKKIQECTV